MAPENISLLHRGEEALRVDALERIGLNPDLVAHLAMTESGMSLIHALLPSTSVLDADQLMLGNLGIRLFNGLAASIKLSLSGYYQAAALQLRDLLETTFLLDYFSTDAALITQWRSISEAERKRLFRPVNIRTALDDRDGFTEKKRAAAYDLLCKLAGHATPEGMIMLIPNRDDTKVHCGPFLENATLDAIIAETAKLAVQAAGAFRIVIKDKSLDDMEAHIVFMEAEAAWFQRFYARPVDHASLAELRSLLTSARSLT